MNLIKEGTADTLAAECGTNGLGTCVGLAISMGANYSQWFIAHVNCGAQVRSTGECYNAVRAFARAKAEELHTPASGSTTYIVATKGEFSRMAIRDGLQEAYASTHPIICEYDGFCVNAVGNIRNPGQAPNTIDGHFQFAVPDLQACH